MFNFIFDSKIGDILAPVVPQNKIFLAIQHFKNAELNELLNSTNYNPSTEVNGVYSPLHVACRYNNKFAVEILLSRGANIQLADQNGDGPLHFAARGGHADLCKFLVENGALVHARNKQNLSPYDVADSHLVRQFLLPLQLAAESGMPQFQQPPSPAFGNIGGAPSYSAPANFAAPSMAMGAPPAYQSPPPLPMGGQSAAGPPPPQLNVPPPTASPMPPMGPPMTGYAVGQVPNFGQAPAARSANTRVIQADGFHSSASDPILQQKYGHVIERPNIAPPPTGQLPFQAATPISGGGISTIPLQPAPAAGIYSRYVAYDAHQNTSAPAPQPMYSAPIPPPAYNTAPAPTTFVPVVSNNNYPAPTFSSAPSVIMAPMQQPTPVMQPLSAPSPSPTPVSATSTAASASPAGGAASRFLGNKAPIATDGDLFTDISINRSPTGAGPPNAFQ